MTEQNDWQAEAASLIDLVVQTITESDRLTAGFPGGAFKVQTAEPVVYQAAVLVQEALSASNPGYRISFDPPIGKDIWFSIERLPEGDVPAPACGRAGQVDLETLCKQEDARREPRIQEILAAVRKSLPAQMRSQHAIEVNGEVSMPVAKILRRRLSQEHPLYEVEVDNLTYEGKVWVIFKRR